MATAKKYAIMRQWYNLEEAKKVDSERATMAVGQRDGCRGCLSGNKSLRQALKCAEARLRQSAWKNVTVRAYRLRQIHHRRPAYLVDTVVVRFDIMIWHSTTTFAKTNDFCSDTVHTHIQMQGKTDKWDL